MPRRPGLLAMTRYGKLVVLLLVTRVAGPLLAMTKRVLLAVYLETKRLAENEVKGKFGGNRGVTRKIGWNLEGDEGRYSFSSSNTHSDGV